MGPLPSTTPCTRPALAATRVTPIIPTAKMASGAEGDSHPIVSHRFRLPRRRVICFAYVTYLANPESFTRLTPGMPVIEVDGLAEAVWRLPRRPGALLPGGIRARSWAWSARTAPARPPRSAASPGSSSRPQGRIRIAGHDLAQDPVARQVRAGLHPRRASPLRVPHGRGAPALRRPALRRRPTSATGFPACWRSWIWPTSAAPLPGELSRGMKQKLAIACGLLHEPQALLLDEPLTGLDPVGIRRMKATIMRRAAAGAAVILSSHLLHLVEEICTRVLVMQRGTGGGIRHHRRDLAGRPELAVAKPGRRLSRPHRSGRRAAER